MKFKKGQMVEITKKPYWDDKRIGKTNCMFLRVGDIGKIIEVDEEMKSYKVKVNNRLVVSPKTLRIGDCIKEQVNEDCLKLI